MGILTCLKCGAKAEGKTKAEAEALIDCGATSIKCDGKLSQSTWTGTAEKTTESKDSKKPKAKAKK